MQKRDDKTVRQTIPVRTLQNIGPMTARWLESIGIHSEDDLAKLGAVEAYKRLKAAYPDRVTLNALYAMHGALLGIPWNLLPKGMRDELRRQVM